jgi:cell division protein FtsL
MTVMKRSTVLIVVLVTFVVGFAAGYVVMHHQTRPNLNQRQMESVATQTAASMNEVPNMIIWDGAWPRPAITVARGHYSNSANPRTLIEEISNHSN